MLFFFDNCLVKNYWAHYKIFAIVFLYLLHKAFFLMRIESKFSPVVKNRAVIQCSTHEDSYSDAEYLGKARIGIRVCSVLNASEIYFFWCWIEEWIPRKMSLNWLSNIFSKLFRVLGKANTGISFIIPVSPIYIWRINISEFSLLLFN